MVRFPVEMPCLEHGPGADWQCPLIRSLYYIRLTLLTCPKHAYGDNISLGTSIAIV